MQIERFYLGCLAHASYIVSDAGEAAVIDPQRDVDLYLDFAREQKLKIRWVVETHLHADFVSGHLELARRSGAAIAIGAAAGATYEHRALYDGDRIEIGNAVLQVLETPGHTEEGICLVARESAEAAPTAVFTGDTLFIGDVGRPDLSPAKTPEELAGLLYDSLHAKLLTLPDATIVFPAHGAGSLCGRSMSSDDSSTIGRERRTNYALQPMPREQFVNLLTGDLPPRPAYFHDEVERNRSGAASLEQLEPLHALTPGEVHALQAEGAIVLDTRPSIQFAAAHVPGSLHIALAGQFASWAARILGVSGVRLVLLAEDDVALEEARLRLARVGIEEIAGSVAGGIMTWIEAGQPVESVDQIAAASVSGWHEAAPDEHVVLDVRDPSEVHAGSIPGAMAIPLPELQARLAELERGASIAVYCRGGYRSAIASSILAAAGFADVLNVTGGYDAWALAQPEAEPALVYTKAL